MLEYSGFILANRTTLGRYFFPVSQDVTENSGVGLYRFHCANYIHSFITKLYGRV